MKFGTGELTREKWNVPALNEIIVVLIIFLCLIIDISYTYKVVWNRFAPKEFLIALTGEAYPTEELPLYDGVELSQTYLGTVDGIGSAVFKLNASEMAENATVSVSVVDESKELEILQKDYQKKDLPDELILELGDFARDVAGHTISFTITSKGIEKENAISLLAVEDAYADGVVSVNGNETTQDLSVVVYPATYQTKAIKKVYVFAMTVLCILAIYVYIMTKKKDVKLERDIFIPVSLLIGIVYMFMLAPFTIPDEGTHFMSAYALSNKMMGVEGDSVVRGEDRFDVYHESMDKYTYSYVSTVLFQHAEDKENNATNPVSGEYLTGPILMYGPAACGITLARLLGLGYTGMILLGRFFSLLFSTACICGAIKLIPFRKEMLFVISTLPMVFQQRSSYSYDGPVIALIFLMTAYLLKLAYEKERIEKKDYIFLILGILFAIPVKVVFAGVILLVLLIPKEKFVYTKSWITKTVLIVGALVSDFVMNSTRLISENGKANAGTGFTIASVLSDIPGTLSMFWRTIQYELGFEIQSLIGCDLGYFKYKFSTEFVVALVVVLTMSVITKKKHDIKPIHRWLYFAIFAMAAGAAFGSMLLAWTPIDSEYIQGVQGRYFLPAFPLLMLCIPEIEISDEAEERINRAAVWGIVLINIWMMSRLYQGVMLS